MAVCWQQRGCDEEMQAECPHSTYLDDRCPSKCAFANCDRGTHEIASEPALLWDPGIDREAAIRENCLYCAFFLRNGPRVP